MESRIIGSANVKNFYRFVNSKIQSKNSSIISLRDNNGLITSDSFNMACMLNNNFSSSFCIDNCSSPLDVNATVPYSHNCIVFPPEAVLLHLRQLKGSKVVSPDGFSPFILKTLAEALVLPLVLLFEFFFSRQYVPECWKISIIKPLFKKGIRSSPGNYRPIANTSIVCRLIEKIILSQLTAYLNKNLIFSPSQHGFRQGRSTVTNLIDSTLDCIFTCDAGHNVDIVFFDFSRAFDSIIFTKLFIKLGRMGIGGDLLGWIKNYVTGRSQSTFLNEVFSPFLPVLSGVPQGSVLGPLLFSIYINDLPDFIISSNPLLHVSLKMFADDVKTYYTVNTVEQALEFQRIINSVYDWCEMWQLQLNFGKCTTLHFGKTNMCFNYGLNGAMISSSNLVRDLGLLIDESLSFSPHISSIVSRARIRCNFFLNLFLFVICQ